MHRNAVVLLLVLGAISCSRVVEHPRQGTGPTESPVAGTLSDTDAYVQATIEIVCLAGRIPDPRDRVEAVWAIYRRYGFEDPNRYLAMVRTVGQQAPIQARIARGTAQCP